MEGGQITVTMTVASRSASRVERSRSGQNTLGYEWMCGSFSGLDGY